MKSAFFSALIAMFMLSADEPNSVQNNSTASLSIADEADDSLSVADILEIQPDITEPSIPVIEIVAQTDEEEDSLDEIADLNDAGPSASEILEDLPAKVETPPAIQKTVVQTDDDDDSYFDAEIVDQVEDSGLVAELLDPSLAKENASFAPEDYLLAQDERQKSPAEIEKELQHDEELFKEAKEMFNPWYAGPLLTGGAHNMPPGSANLQPYVFYTNNYGLWNHERKKVPVPHKGNLNPSINGFNFGLTDWLDMSFTTQWDVNWLEGRRGGGWGDSTLGVGFPLLKEGLNCPALRLVVTEIFPSGRYQRLNPHKLGTDSTGGGSYQTQFGLRISKLVFWSYKHPMNLRGSYSYQIPAKVTVHGFNAYGGGYGAKGKVNPGNTNQLNLAAEYSFTQRWVFSLDAVYVWQNKTKFKGFPGTLADGTLSVNKYGSSDQLSFAPAIEYNPNANLSYLGGVWFDVYGRNTSRFIAYIVSVEYTWDW